MSPSSILRRTSSDNEERRTPREGEARVRRLVARISSAILSRSQAPASKLLLPPIMPTIRFGMTRIPPSIKMHDALSFISECPSWDKWKMNEVADFVFFSCHQPYSPIDLFLHVRAVRAAAKVEDPASPIPYDAYCFIGVSLIEAAFRTIHSAVYSHDEPRATSEFTTANIMLQNNYKCTILLLACLFYRTTTLPMAVPRECAGPHDIMESATMTVFV